MTATELVKQTTPQLPLCLNQDRHQLKRQLDRLHADCQKGKAPLDQIHTLENRISQSVAARTNLTFWLGKTEHSF